MRHLSLERFAPGPLLFLTPQETPFFFRLRQVDHRVWLSPPCFLEAFPDSALKPALSIDKKMPNYLFAIIKNANSTEASSKAAPTGRSRGYNGQSVDRVASNRDHSAKRMLFNLYSSKSRRIDKRAFCSEGLVFRANFSSLRALFVASPYSRAHLRVLSIRPYPNGLLGVLGGHTLTATSSFHSLAAPGGIMRPDGPAGLLNFVWALNLIREFGPYPLQAKLLEARSIRKWLWIAAKAHHFDP
ncbi:hypothetical protein BKA70DRAFT_1214822 [Coprinopsis sp. MPI-PUGE-AT-0042]|nr:hypothetical protein BKA70DRAFT_1214822 [Coprinopsis sp. MPI-PUGE-AT-0042]